MTGTSRAYLHCSTDGGECQKRGQFSILLKRTMSLAAKRPSLRINLPSSILMIFPPRMVEGYSKPDFFHSTTRYSLIKFLLGSCFVILNDKTNAGP